MGRGTDYGRSRGIFERTLDTLYRGHWPARLTWRAGFQRRLERITVDVPAPSWPQGLRPLRAVFASDFHAGPTTDLRSLEQACHAIEALEPDVILLGGDFILFRHEYVDPLARLFEKLRAPWGKFAVLGNHDLWVDEHYIEQRLADAGITLLTNANARLPAPFEHVSVVGLDDAWVGKPDMKRALEGAQDTRILLMHAPSGLLHVENTRFDVAFCGHTHGGQISLPGGIPVFAPGPLAREYNAGVFHLPQGTLVTSRGVGYGELPIRLFAPRDVALCRLGATSARASR